MEQTGKRSFTTVAAALAALLLILAAVPAKAHGPQGHGPDAVRSQKTPQPADKHAKPGMRQLAVQAEDPVGAQRFCMKNQQGKVHCIPFGPGH